MGKPNTSLSIISRIAKSSNLTYEQILNHYLHADIVPAEDYLNNNGYVSGGRRDIFIEEAMNRAQVDAGRRHNSDKIESVSRFVLQPKLMNPVPRPETSPELKLVRKVNKRSEKKL